MTFRNFPSRKRSLPTQWLWIHQMYPLHTDYYPENNILFFFLDFNGKHQLSMRPYTNKNPNSTVTRREAISLATCNSTVFLGGRYTKKFSFNTSSLQYSHIVRFPTTCISRHAILQSSCKLHEKLPCTLTWPYVTLILTFWLKSRSTKNESSTIKFFPN